MPSSARFRDLASHLVGAVSYTHLDVYKRQSLLYAILVSIVGGSGNITGAWIAGILIGFTENVTVMFIGSGWREAISLALIIIFMLVKPSAFGGNED